MDFNLSKEQRDIVQAARKFAAGEFPERAVEFDREEKFDFAIWRKACELGFVGAHVPEQYGGANTDILSTMLIMEGLGYATRDHGLLF